MNLNSAEMDAEVELHRMVTAWCLIRRRKGAEGRRGLGDLEFGHVVHAVSVFWVGCVNDTLKREQRTDTS
jgi:hypothetical protein